jgi:hypothetical protein
MFNCRLAPLLIALALAISCVQSGAQGTISHSQGTTLAGDVVTLPDAVKGKVGVLVVGFSHASQGQVEAWGRRLLVVYGQSSVVVYFEVPMLAGAPKLLRRMIVKKMASSVSVAERPHFLPITENETAWRAAAHYARPDDAYVLVIDGDGKVLWQTEGDATDAAYGALRQNVTRLSAQSGAH